MRKGLIACFLAAVMLLTACKNANSERPELLKPVNARLETALCERMDLCDMTIYDGQLLPDTIEVCFDIDGYLNELYVSAGDYVEEGEVLASLVGENYKRINSLTEEIDSLLEETEERFKYLEAELELARLAGDDIAEKELELKHEKAMSDLKIREKQDLLESLSKDDIGYIYVISPMDTIVMAASSTRSGGYIPAGTPVAALDAGEGLTLTCTYVSEIAMRDMSEYYALIHGNKYELEFMPYSKEELRIMAINSVTPVSRFKLKGDTSGIEPGDYAAVVLIGDRKENVLVVPSNAVYSDSSGKYVYEVNDNIRTRREVVTGITDGAYIEIVEGIEEGASVYVKN